MNIRLLSEPADLQKYNQWMTQHSHATLWQSLSWKKYQEALGRQTRLYAAEDNGTILASALIVIDRTTGGYSTWDCPRGPLLDEQKADVSRQLLDRILEDAKKEKAIALYLSPINQLTSDRPLTSSPRHEQPAATLAIDLTQSEEQILLQMHPKGRYNIKVSERYNVTVRESTDIDAFFRLMKTTGQRDGFTIGNTGRYSVFLQHLEHSFLLLAYAADKPIAGLIGVLWNGTGIYYYGASSSEDRQIMAPYLLQWETMKYCKTKGCHTYDLLGIDPPEQESAWKGVTEFKRKFGGKMMTYPPEQMIVLKPMVQKMLQWKRKILG